MANLSKTLKETLRFDRIALETTANLVSTLYLLNMSDRSVDVDQRYNFGTVKDLIISTMGYDLFSLENVVNFWDCDFCFKPEGSADDIERFYLQVIEKVKQEENEARFKSSPVDGCDDCAYYTEAMGTPTTCPECEVDYQELDSGVRYTLTTHLVDTSKK